MTTITNSGTFTVGDSAVAAESVTLTVVPAASTGDGRGRLIHPSLGVLDYPYSPDKWTNIHGDLFVPPVINTTKALRGSTNTLFAGHIRDVECVETWDSDVISLPFFLALASFWMNPPDPSVAYVEWYPSYTSSLGYKVLLKNLTVGGEGINLSYITRQGVVEGPVELTLRVCGRM